MASFCSVPAAYAETPVIVQQAFSTDAAIEGLMAQIRASKSLPGWAASAYAVYKTWRNGQSVEEVRATVAAILKEIAVLKADAEKSREMTMQEQRLTRALLEAYGSRLQAYEERLAAIEKEMEIVRKEMAPSSHRGGARQAGRPWPHRCCEAPPSGFKAGWRFPKAAR